MNRVELVRIIKKKGLTFQDVADKMGNGMGYVDISCKIASLRGFNKKEKKKLKEILSLTDEEESVVFESLWKQMWRTVEVETLIELGISAVVIGIGVLVLILVLVLKG